MKLEFFNNKDFWAGMMLIGTGATAIFIAWHYPFGSMQRIGSGFFPRVLGGILILFGIYVMVRGLCKSEKINGSWSLRALIVLPLFMVLFGVLMEHAGFIPALAVLIFGSAAASREFKLVETLLFTAFLVVLSVAMFIWGLGLPFSLIKSF